MAHYPPARCVAVAVEATIPAAPAPPAAAAAAAAPRIEGVEAGILRCFDDATFEPLPGAVLELDPHELVTSLSAAYLGIPTVEGSGGPAGGDMRDGDAAAPSGGSSSAAGSYLVVGTSYVLDDEEEPSRGRILVLRVTGAGAERRLRIEASREVSGGVLRVAPFVGGRLVVAINSKVQVYTWAALQSGGGRRRGAAGASGAAAAAPIAEEGAFGLVPECGFAGHTLAL